MSLTNTDLKSIEKIVRSSEDRLNDRITNVEIRQDKKIDSLEDRLNKKIDNLDVKIDDAEKRITSTLSREISDLADINRTVITKTEELDYRLRIVERKLGLAAK